MIIKRNFYNRNTIQVAKNLLGCFLVREYRGKIIKAMITETEAYRGEYDLACHASKGNTSRTKVMYGQPGHAYVYMIYGMYFILNIVTEKKDFPAAVLIRSAKIVGAVHEPPLHGPGKLTKYLNINKLLNGWDLTKGRELWLESASSPRFASLAESRRGEAGRRKSKKRYKIIKSMRIGVDYAKHCKEWKWNFKIANSS